MFPGPQVSCKRYFLSASHAAVRCLACYIASGVTLAAQNFSTGDFASQGSMKICVKRKIICIKTLLTTAATSSARAYYTAIFQPEVNARNKKSAPLAGVKPAHQYSEIAYLA